jgi:hypothetical protein
VKVNGMAQRQGPEIAVIVLRPPKSCIYHHSAAGTNGVLDGILGNTIMMMTPDTTVTDTLSLGRKFRSELTRGIDPIVSAICTNLNTGARGVALKTKLGLNCFSAGETNLVDH